MKFSLPIEGINQALKLELILFNFAVKCRQAYA